MIPVIIFTGYLGAGKTSSLNSLLKTDWVKNKKVALIINEFGNIGIDGKLVEPGDYTKYEINRGSIFCICTKTDFVKYLTQISEEIKPDLIIIEATGIAETRDIESFIKEPHLKGKFKVYANICILDAVNFTKTVPFFKPVISQLLWADCVIINKTDLASEKQIEAVKAIAAENNPQAKILCAEFGRFSPNVLNDIKHITREGEALEMPPEPVFSIPFNINQSVDEEKFLAVIKSLGKNLLRLKGNIDFGKGSEYFEVVAGDIFRGKECGGLGKTAFVVIAWQADKEKVKSEFEASFN